jgi:hypothetical protein
MSTMDIRKSAILERSLVALREQESWLRSKGVVHAAVFGSVARGDDDQNSDVDVLLELAPNAPVGTPEILQIEDALVAARGRSVDIIEEMVPAF